MKELGAKTGRSSQILNHDCDKKRGVCEQANPISGIVQSVLSFGLSFLFEKLCLSACRLFPGLVSFSSAGPLSTAFDSHPLPSKNFPSARQPVHFCAEVNVCLV